MKITWLGQMGIYLEGEKSSVMIDPYLKDTLFEKVGERCRRLTAPEEKWLDIHPDILLISHEHTDHLDIPSLEAVLDTPKDIDVLCAPNAWRKAREAFGSTKNFVSMYCGSEWSTKNVHIRSVPAIHSDETAVGFLIHMDGLTLYFTGDTLYSERLVSAVNERVDIMFAAVNGQGNNMNYLDAARLASRIKPKKVIPVHWGMFKGSTVSPEPFRKKAMEFGLDPYVMQVYEETESAKLLLEN